MKVKYLITGLLFVALFTVMAASAQVRLPQLISNGMVLQRNVKVHLWGWAAPGEKVKIKFLKKKYSAVTGANGQWLITLGAMPAGGPYSMEISASNHIVIHDILIGDVWFCSGQSNMVLPMYRVKERYPHEIDSAHYPQIRNFFIPTASDVSKVHDDLPPGQWKAATPKNVPGFGAASYFFAKMLYKKYHVPIGIINSSVGGTPIQAWISEGGLKDIPRYADRLKMLKDTAYLNRLLSNTEKMREQAAKQVKITDKGLIGPKPWFDTSYIAKGWHHFWLPGYWDDQGVRHLNGVVWFRKEIDVPASMTGKPAKLVMGRIVDANKTYVNGRFAGTITYQYPPSIYQLPAGMLKPGKNIIVVRVVSNEGKGGFVPDKPYFVTDGTKKIDLRGDWQYKVGQVFPRERRPFIPTLVAQNEPTGLYNTMVAPAVNYTIKGIVWYQGETNTDRPAEYDQLLPALITDWRRKWQEGNIPFIYAQLPNFMEVDYSPEESNWARLREAQLKALALPNTAMAVTIGAGEWNDIHPLDKKDVGDRLALGAEKIAYGDTALVASGPIYQSAMVQGNKIAISFSSIGGGLVAKGDGKLKQFEIAGADGKYVWANAVIEGNKVVVWSDEVARPLYVRYAWADNPQGANLYNKAGLPASPFTTDER